jgi:methylmalonyl-CoA mutase
VFEAIVEAAASGATVGELSRTFRHDADPELQVTPLEAWRAGAMFERLRAAVRDHADAAATTVFCANLGNVARYMPRLDFTRGFFQTGGFTVQADRFYSSADDAAEAARQAGAATAVIVGLDDTYAELAADTARALKAAGVGTVLLAGLPKDLVDDLRTAGVDDFIHVRSDAHAALSDLARSKGVAL